MALSDATERALESCFEAIVAPDRWAAALDNLAHSIGAHACLILPHEIADRQFGVVGSTEMAKMGEHARNQDWVTPVYEPRGDPFVRSGYQAVLQQQLFTDEEIRRSRFHQEVARPAGLHQWACGIFTAEGRYWCMPFFRSTDPFAPEDLEPIAEIARRVSQVVSISVKVSQTSTENEVRTLEQVGCAAMLIDRHGSVGRINRRAEDLFCCDFGVRNGKLWTSSNASLARLDRFMAELSSSKSTSPSLPAPVIIARAGSPWLLIEALPVASKSLEIFDGCLALLLVSDLTSSASADDSVLRLAYGLTGAEARLASAICGGHDLNAIAGSLGVSRETLRGQLKTVFAKTGARRQAELVARVANIRNVVRH